jgi:hypothetical protein
VRHKERGLAIMTLLQRMPNHFGSGEKGPRKVLGMRLLNVTVFITMILLMRTGIDLALQMKPVQSAIERLSEWRLKLLDPGLGSPVALNVLVPVAQHPGQLKGTRFRATLICMTSTCSA